MTNSSECSSAGSAPALTEQLIQAAVDYELGRIGRPALSAARAAVEAAISASAQPAALRAAAERVCWFDWSGNDMDAVAAIDALRKAITSQPSPAATVETGKCTGLCNDGSGEGCNCSPAAHQRLSAATEGARLSNWLADYSHDLKEEGDFDQEAGQLDKASQWIASHLNVLPQEVPQSYRDTVRRVGAAREKRLREFRDALQALVTAIYRHGNWDDGCFYYGATSASELQGPLKLAETALALSRPHGGGK